MKRKPLTHERIFSNENYAERYAQQHWKMAEKFGQQYTQKLASQGFDQGKIIDVGCGFGATNLVLAERFVESEIVGIDLSEPLLELAREAAEERNLMSEFDLKKRMFIKYLTRRIHLMLPSISTWCIWLITRSKC